MAYPMKIRASMMGDKVVVKALITHDMETGLAKDSSGKTIPAWFIQQLIGTHNGKTVFNAQLGPSVSKNPSLEFRFSGGKLGEKVKLTWIDNKGETRSDEKEIA
jgi:sulfur-oxidizing protein SoxZ